VVTGPSQPRPFNVQLWIQGGLVRFNIDLREFAAIKSAMPSYADKLDAARTNDLCLLFSLKGQVK